MVQNVGHWQLCRCGPHRPRGAGGPVGHGGPQKCRKLKYSMGSFGLESILVTEVSILNPVLSFENNFTAYHMYYNINY